MTLYDREAMKEALDKAGWTVVSFDSLEIRHEETRSVMRGELARQVVNEAMAAVNICSISSVATSSKSDNERQKQGGCTVKLRMACAALESVFGKPKSSGAPVAVSDESPDGWSNGLPFTKKEWRERVKFESALCAFMTQRCAVMDGPNHEFKRIATFGVDFTNYGLDAVSTDGRYIVDFRRANSPFTKFDVQKHSGAAISDWKIKCADIACGCPGSYGEKFPRYASFSSALFVYCDSLNNVYQLPLSRLNRVIRHLATSPDDGDYPRGTYGYFDDKNDPCWYIPTCYWEHLGNLDGGSKKFQSDRSYVEVPSSVPSSEKHRR